jgi:23S rRNA (cytosine1962-C5)-methyltransferase
MKRTGDTAQTAKLRAAWERRAALQGDPATNAYRLINGAADGFPGLTVDRFATVLVANLYGGHQTAMKPPTRLLETLAGLAEAQAVYVKQRPAEASKLDEATRRALAPDKPLLGTATAEVEVLESGLRYIIRPGEGLSTGLFLDMRAERAAVRAASAGRTVLNCFAYSCAFGAAALAGGAARAVNLDVSKRYLEWGRENYARNGLEAIKTDFIFGDVFDWLKRFGRAGQRFDLVILDPPSFATTRQTRFTVERDYAALVRLAEPVVAPGGSLLACANSRALSERVFLSQIGQGLGNRPHRLEPVRGAPEVDFPPGGEEGTALKAVWIKVKDASGRKDDRRPKAQNGRMTV